MSGKICQGDERWIIPKEYSLEELVKPWNSTTHCLDNSSKHRRMNEQDLQHTGNLYKFHISQAKVLNED